MSTNEKLSMMLNRSIIHHIAGAISKLINSAKPSITLSLFIKANGFKQSGLIKGRVITIQIIINSKCKS